MDGYIDRWIDSVYSAYHCKSGRPFPGPDVWIDIYTQTGGWIFYNAYLEAREVHSMHSRWGVRSEAPNNNKIIGARMYYAI
jgi:hypothetical protein